MFQIDNKAIQSIFTQTQNYGSNNEYYKFKTGAHRVRFCGPWSEEGIPFRMIYNHGSVGNNLKDSGGRERSPLCYNFIFKTVNESGQFYIAKALANKIGVDKVKEAYDNWQKFGCIGCKIADLMKSQNKRFGSLKFMWNIVVRSEQDANNPYGKVYKWSTSKEQFTTLVNYYNMYNLLFDINQGYDMNVNATGEKLTRRYTITPIPSPCPQGDVKLFDLDQGMADGFCTLTETLEMVNNTIPEVLPLLGINPAMFGGSGVPF